MQSQMTVPALCERLCALAPGMVVGIEGLMASGKSSLAKTVAANIAAQVIHLDDYLVQSEDEIPYADRIDYDHLGQAFAESMTNNSCLLVEGICLQEVLSRLGIHPELSIYVKRVAASGLWHDGFHLQDFELKADCGPHEVHRSDLRYHSQFRPHERAAIVIPRED